MDDRTRHSYVETCPRHAGPRTHRLSALKATTALTSAALATAIIAMPALVLPQRAVAGDLLPTGSQVIAGAVSIGTTGTPGTPGTGMTVTQGTDKAIVNWDGFSIGTGNSVTFVQPGATSAILNRVTGSMTSTIAGTLTGNGQVYLINPNGIAITPTGTVKVGNGFVASTLDIANDDFLNGRNRFLGTGTSAPVSNSGLISIGRGGYVALLGGTVRNDGLIAVPLGKVGLGSGQEATLDLSGDGFLQVAVPTKAGVEGTGALIDNAGTVRADGGTVVMRAAAARDLARHAINLSGVVEARSIGGRDGAIVIGGDLGGKVTISGKLVATSPTGKGGKVTVTGKAIDLKSGSIDVSGTLGGGTVKIGGDKQGTGTLPHADTVSIDKASTIKADATLTGPGGSIVVWSGKLTSFAGLITALGAGTDKGGDAEVSGKAVLDYTGFANLSGPGGFGTLTLDPYNVTISTATGSNASGFTATGNDSVINVTTLTNALAGANVTISTGTSGTQAGDITVAAPITWTSGSTLTLSAANNISINANITATGTNAGLVLNYGNYATAGTVASGTDYLISNGASITLSGNSSTFQVNGSAYTLIRSATDLQNMQNNVNGNYVLAVDIDASVTASWNGGAGFSPVGTPGANQFVGNIEGNGHVISGLTINRPGQQLVGLFGDLGAYGNTRIRNFGVVQANVVGGDYTGIVAGNNHDQLINIYATGTVTGESNTGGIVGCNCGNGSLKYVSFIGTVSGTYAVGGIVGQSGYPLTDGYSSGSVSASNIYAGGVVGVNFGPIANTSTNSTVRGGTSIGALVGLNTGSWSFTASFFNKDVAGQLPAAGDHSLSEVTGLTTAQMQNPFTFINAGWDFSGIWGKSITGANGGYMMLRGLSTGLYDDYVALSGNTTKIYGDTNPSLSGLTVTGLGASNVTLGWSGSIDRTTNAGIYSYSSGTVVSVTDQLGRTAYVDYGTSTLTVSARPITITADPKTMIYGDAVPGLTYGVTSGSLVNGDGLTGALSTLATATSNVGTYAITQGTLTASNNYAVTFVPGQLSVTPAMLTVTAGDGSMFQGAQVAGLTYTVAGWKNGQTDALLSGVAVAADATAFSLPGTYATWASGGILSGAALGNYTLAYVPGHLTVSRPIVSGTSGDTLIGTIDTPAPETPQTVSYAGPLQEMGPGPILTTRTLLCRPGPGGPRSTATCATP